MQASALRLGLVGHPGGPTSPLGLDPGVFVVLLEVAFGHGENAERIHAAHERHVRRQVTARRGVDRASEVAGFLRSVGMG